MSSNYMNKSYKNNIEPKKPGTKEYVLYESIYRKLQNRQNKSFLLEVRIMVSVHWKPWWWGVGIVPGKGMASGTLIVFYFLIWVRAT